MCYTLCYTLLSCDAFDIVLSLHCNQKIKGLLLVSKVTAIDG